jgi:hypothetical protein
MRIARQKVSRSTEWGRLVYKILSNHRQGFIALTTGNGATIKTKKKSKPSDRFNGAVRQNYQSWKEYFSF